MLNIRNLLGVFESIPNVLVENGWFIDKPESPRWWGGAENPDEVIISAVLVQQTRWENAVKAMVKLRSLGLNTLSAISMLNESELAELIRGVNFRFIKARRIINIARRIISIGGLRALDGMSDGDVRGMLLSMEGVGYETADSIMLFALNRLTIPISTYTVRVISRVKGDFNGDYEELRTKLINELPRELYYYKLFHAGVVTIGKMWCLKEKPKCVNCPLRNHCNYSR